MAKKNETQDQTQEQTEVTTETLVIKQPTKRTRRVTSEITLPKDGSTIGVLTYNVAGIEGAITKEVDLSTLAQNVINEAVLVGLNTRVGIAYSGILEPEKVLEAIDKEFQNFAEGKYISRASMERKINAPDIVIAWITSVGADIADHSVVTKYVTAWATYDDERKNTIANNRKVIIALEELQAARRLEKKAKTAVDDDSLLEL